MLAAGKGRWEVCLKLAELGADLNKANNVSETCGNCMSVWLLYHLSRPPSSLNKGGRTVLVLAAEEGQWEVCLKLAELGADINKANYVRETCSNCISLCCCIIVMPIYFFELGWQDSLDVGC